jgi:hypothetical protein
MAVKSLDLRRTKCALRASGVGRGPVIGLLWPFGRERRARALLRERRAALEAKNGVVEYLFRAQRPLESLRLGRPEDVTKALQQPDTRSLIMSVGITRAMIDEALVSRFGAEGGRAVDTALAELIAGGVVTKASAMPASSQEIYVALQGRGRPLFDLSEVSRLLEDGREHGTELRQRLQREEATRRGRTHYL